MNAFIGSHGKCAEIIAHRGFLLQFPENTLVAFRKSLSLGASGVELDVQMSSDGVPVVIHDKTIDRTTNGHGPVSGMTFKQLRKYDAGIKFALAYRSEKIPSLREALWTIKGKGKVIIEVKETVNKAGLELVLKEIYMCGMEKWSTLISFDINQLEYLRQLDSNIVLGKLLLPEDANLERIKSTNISIASAPYQAFLEIPELLPLLFSQGLTPNAFGIPSRKVTRCMLQKGIYLLSCDKAL